VAGVAGAGRVRRAFAGPIRGEQAAGAQGRRAQDAWWQVRRAARLAELGFEDLASYLRARHVGQGRLVRRMRAELGVGKAWLVDEVRRLGIKQ
jgi:hypothetical protein